MQVLSIAKTQSRTVSAYSTRQQSQNGSVAKWFKVEGKLVCRWFPAEGE